MSSPAAFGTVKPFLLLFIKYLQFLERWVWPGMFDFYSKTAKGFSTRWWWYMSQNLAHRVGDHEGNLPFLPPCMKKASNSYCFPRWVFPLLLLSGARGWEKDEQGIFPCSSGRGKVDGSCLRQSLIIWHDTMAKIQGRVRVLITVGCLLVDFMLLCWKKIW